MGAGVIDSYYRGLVAVVFFNVCNRVFEMNKGHRFAQIIFQNDDWCSSLREVLTFNDTTQRGQGSFGSYCLK